MNFTIKLGGASGVPCDALLDDIAAHHHARPGDRLTLVHGGSDETTRLQEALGHPAQFLHSPSGQVSRRTDRQDLQAFAMATAWINRRLTESLLLREVRAFGFSGLDGATARGTRKDTVRAVEKGRTRMIRNQWTGRPERVETTAIEALHAAGFLPVIAPIIAGAKGEMLNTDGDRLAAAIAGALGDETLVILTNVPGLLEDPSREDSLVKFIGRDELDSAAKFAQGRMRKKILGAREALDQGVRRVVIADARRAKPLSDALAGMGTVLGRPFPAPSLKGVPS